MSSKFETWNEGLLRIGDICIVTQGLYKGIKVKIIRLPDKNDNRYSVLRDGFAGLRFEHKELAKMDEVQE